MQTIFDELVTVSGGQTRPSIVPLPMPPNPNMTRPPHMGFDAVRQYGPAGGMKPPTDGDGGGGGHSRQIVKRHMLM